jgi:DNA-binding winged helix-turn-helix (wHTH) protein/tetratricopeptide (TPR) repeat protein
LAVEPLKLSPAEPESLRIWRFAHVVLDERTMDLKVRGKSTRLHRKPLQVLQHLLHHAGEVVTKDELAEACWPRRVLSDTVLTTTINRLRAALDDQSQTLIKTVHGFGYRFVGALQVEWGPDTPPARVALERGGQPPLRPSWKLLERLGAGGNADVWLAEHPHTRERRVYKFAIDGAALKGLKREIALYRVLREAHGNRHDLVRVLDWNFEQAPFYIESEYLAAGSLEQWSEDRGGLGAIAPSLRIELMAQCAETLSMAHALGVLHKDLKPSNILVAEEPGHAPCIKLCDFGSGDLLDTGVGKLHLSRTVSLTRTQRDGSGGTPMYLPPEALLGQPATVQGDVYALGVMLYQAIVGDWKRPLAPGWERDIPDELLREDVAAAVDGDPSRRLADAAELARRLRALDERRGLRQQEREAEASNVALRERMRHLEVRRRSLRLTVAVLLLGLGSTLALAFMLLATQREREAALQQAKQEASVSRQVTAYLASLFDAASPERTGGKAISPRALVDQGQAEIDNGLASDGLLHARMLETIGSLYCKLGLPEECRKDVEQALAYQRRGLDADPLALASALYWLGEARSQEARHVEAERAFREALPILESNLGPKDARHTDALVSLGSVLRSVGKTGESVSVLERARDLLRGPDGSDSPESAAALGALALSYQDAGRMDEAATLAAKSLDLVRTRFGSDSIEYFTALDQYANVMGDLDRDAECTTALREVVPGYARIVGFGSKRTLEAEQDLGVCLMASGHLEEASHWARRAMDGYRTLEGSAGENFGEAEGNVGRILFYRGEYALAEPYLRDSYRIIRGHHPQQPDLDTLSAGFDVARPLIYLGRTDEARELLQPEVPAVLESGYSKYMRAMRLRWLAEYHAATGDYAQAERSLDQALAYFATFKSAEGAVVTKVREARAWLLLRERRYREAVTLLRPVVAQYQQLYQSDSANTQSANVALAYGLYALHEPREAAGLIAQATPVIERELAPTHEVAKTLRQLRTKARPH